MVRVLGHARMVPRVGRGRVFVIASLFLWGNLVGLSYAHVTNPNHGNQGNDCAGSGTGWTMDQVVSLDAGESVKLSCLVGVHGQSIQVGDKLFDDFSFKFGDTDGNRCNDLKSSAISVTALANSTGYGLAFTGPFTATGNITKDLTICYSVTVTDPNYLISSVHLGNSGTVCGNGFSSVVEKVFTDSSCHNKVAELEVLNPGKPNPVFQDLVVLTQPREQLYVHQDITFGGGRLGNWNRGLLMTVDDIFSQSAQIPEPSTMALLVVGLLILLIVQRRGPSRG
jgi:hypothetical protein